MFQARRMQVIKLFVFYALASTIKKQQEEQAITRMTAPATAATMLEDDVDDDNESDNEEGGGGKDSSSSVTVGSGSKKAQPKLYTSMKKKRKLATKRKRRIELTIDQKLDILDEIERKEMTQNDICKKHNTTKSTVTNWKKNRAALEKAQKEMHRGKKKHIYEKDGLNRIKDGLLAFYELNEIMPRALKLPITRKLFRYVVCAQLNSMYSYIPHSMFIHFIHTRVSSCYHSHAYQEQAFGAE